MEPEFNSIDPEPRNGGIFTFTKGEEIIDFVREVKKRPCLYDNTLKEYSNAAYTKPAWREIASKLNTTATDCKEKWRKIRVAFMRSVKQFQSNNPPNRPYWLADHLQFLIPFMHMYMKSGDKSKNTKRRSDLIDMETIVIKQEDDSDLEAVDDGIEDRVDYVKDKTGNGEVSGGVVDIFNSSECNMTAPHRGFKRHHEFGEYSARKMFLLSLLPEIESFNQQEMRLFRRHIVNVVDNILTRRDDNS
ncbi:uncharacterized protein LOC131852111 [Achroia grisella]|uniref:uncharacterized protein LOC131852111 n=1 Tax=Achroia grisella TaxID=688607 RepID=UPI0027D27C7C|nr:uncharacterized protein LOC131852111 [Achroia grisella]